MSTLAGTQFAPEVVEALVAVVSREAAGDPAWQLAIAEPAARGAAPVERVA